MRKQWTVLLNAENSLLSEQFYIQLIRTFLKNSKFSRHLPLGDLYESFIFLSWSLSIIHMVTYFKKHKNHLSVIIAPMLKIVYVENSEQFLWENSEQFYLMHKTDFINAVQKFEYTVNMMCREQILLT